MIYFAVFVVVIGVVVGLLLVHTETMPEATASRGGWVYFASALESDEERPSPIKIGMTRRNPALDRLPEIAAMSPEPLTLLYSFFTETPELEEKRIHAELKAFRQHGEWFERYPVLAYIDNIKGERYARK